MTDTPAPAEALSREQLEALKGHTPAPWAWRGHPTHRDSVPKHPYLRSEVSPRYIVMDFVRQGMQGAQPRFIHRNTGAGIMRPVSEMGAGWAAHPDARLIAAAPDLLTTALAALARAEAAEARVRELENTARIWKAEAEANPDNKSMAILAACADEILGIPPFAALAGSPS